MASVEIEKCLSKVIFKFYKKEERYVTNDSDKYGEEGTN
jgi:hypothetical protein